MTAQETPLVFKCGDSRLIGILHQPECGQKKGVLIVVGGPQTRVGSHRQFLLLARYLADHGIPVFRFDCRGMGDSDGLRRSFTQSHDDIRAAIDAFQQASEVEEVILWGLCDAASAATFYAHTDDRVKGIVLLNPWVRTEVGLARAYIRSHYLKRIFNRNFWRKIRRGEFSYIHSATSFLGVLKNAFSGKRRIFLGSENRVLERHPTRQLPEQMADGVDRFDGKVLIILSGKDMTAEEFRNIVKSSSKWRDLLNRGNIVKKELPDADHTLSKTVWREQVEMWTLEWLGET